MSRYRVENAAHLAGALTRAAANRPDAPNVSYAVAVFQKAARALHRMDERACCEDLTCPKCDGNGFVFLTCSAPGAPEPKVDRASDRADCRACAGSGLTTGRSEARIMAECRALAAAFSFRAYQQGDCRGWPLYLVPDHYPPSEDASWYSSRGVAVCPE